MATTETFDLWKTVMPVFAEMTRMEFYKEEIKSGRQQYKDFYIFFKNNLLATFDELVGIEQEHSSAYKSYGTYNETRSVSLKFWQQLPWDIRVKTYLTLYGIELEAQENPDFLNEREVNILRWAALLLHIGCSKRSKTSKTHVYSFLGALYMI